MIEQLQTGPRGTVQPGGAIRLLQLHCALCGSALQTDDEFILVPSEPLNAEEAGKHARGEPFMARCDPGHWSCLLARWIRLAVWLPGRDELWRGPANA